jgi:TATA-box binding protein (TBP) (component of TFIID and TFIIIB)
LKLGIELDLVEVAHIFLSKYDKSIFPAVVVKCWNTKATVCVFKSGDIVITGAKSNDGKRLEPGINVAILTAQLTAYRLSHCLGFAVRIYKIRIPNIVASMALGFPLDMAAVRKRTMRRQRQVASLGRESEIRSWESRLLSSATAS